MPVWAKSPGEFPFDDRPRLNAALATEAGRQLRSLYRFGRRAALRVTLNQDSNQEGRNGGPS